MVRQVVHLLFLACLRLSPLGAASVCYSSLLAWEVLYLGFALDFVASAASGILFTLGLFLGRFLTRRAVLCGNSSFAAGEILLALYSCVSVCVFGLPMSGNHSLDLVVPLHFRVGRSCVGAVIPQFLDLPWVFLVHSVHLVGLGNISTVVFFSGHFRPLICLP